MKKLILGFVVCALVVTPALANITILDQYPGAAYTYTLYDFTVGYPQGDGSIIIPYKDWNTNIQGIGTPLPLIATPSPPGGFMNGWYPEDDGYVYGVHDVHIDIPYIPNLYNPDAYKLVQVEVVYWVSETGGLDGYALLASGNISSVQDPEVRDLGNGFYDVTWTWKVWPQPEFEAISFTLLGTNGITVESVEVATVCVPAPAAVILGSIGTVLVGWLRRRRYL